MDRPHARCYAIAAKKKPRANLVNSRNNYERLHRRPCPILFLRHSATQARYLESRRINSGEAPQAIRDSLQYAALSTVEGFGDFPCSVKSCIDYDAAINDKQSPERGLANRTLGCLTGEMKDSNVDRSGLTNAGR